MREIFRPWPDRGRDNEDDVTNEHWYAVGGVDTRPEAFRIGNFPRLPGGVAAHVAQNIGYITLHPQFGANRSECQGQTGAEQKGHDETACAAPPEIAGPDWQQQCGKI